MPNLITGGTMPSALSTGLSRRTSTTTVRDFLRTRNVCQCVCDICVCGSHRCPPEYHPPEAYPSDTLSQTAATYIKHPINKPHLHAPEQHQILATGSFQGSSSYTTDFSKRSDYKYQPPVIPIKSTLHLFDGDREVKTSYYNQEFVKQAVDPVLSCKPETSVFRTDAPFVARSSNQLDYIQHNVPPSAPIRPIQSTLEISGDGESSFDTSYRDVHRLFKLESTAQYRPKETKPWNAYGDRFEGESTNTRTFIEHNITSFPSKSKGRENRPLTLVDEVSADKDNWKSETKSQFLNKKSSFTGIIRASQNNTCLYTGNEEKLEGESTTHSQYIQHIVSPPISHKPYQKEYQNENSRSYLTETAENFVPHSYSKREPIRGETKSWLSDNGAPFTGIPTQKQEFSDKGNCVRPMILPFGRQMDPYDETNYMSTTAAEFGKPPLVRTQIMRPPRNVVNNDEDRTFETEHKQQYWEKKSNNCPAIPLLSSTRDASGHVQFQRDPLGTWKRVL